MKCTGLLETLGRAAGACLSCLTQSLAAVAVAALPVLTVMHVRATPAAADEPPIQLSEFSLNFTASMTTAGCAIFTSEVAHEGAPISSQTSVYRMAAIMEGEPEIPDSQVIARIRDNRSSNTAECGTVDFSTSASVASLSPESLGTTVFTTTSALFDHYALQLEIADFEMSPIEARPYISTAGQSTVIPLSGVSSSLAAIVPYWSLWGGIKKWLRKIPVIKSAIALWELSDIIMEALSGAGHLSSGDLHLLLSNLISMMLGVFPGTVLLSLLWDLLQQCGGDLALNYMLLELLRMLCGALGWPAGVCDSLRVSPDKVAEDIRRANDWNGAGGQTYR